MFGVFRIAAARGFLSALAIGVKAAPNVTLFCGILAVRLR
jgi:hypothetical protein